MNAVALRQNACRLLIGRAWKYMTEQARRTIVIDPADYIPEEEVQERWGMLKAGELRRARKRGLVEFYAFPSGPRYTREAIQRYIDQNYLRRVNLVEDAATSPLITASRKPPALNGLSEEVLSAVAEASAARMAANRAKRSPPKSVQRR